jgi:pimeloyl-ACP methyl ester carboxylesterase
MEPEPCAPSAPPSSGEVTRCPVSEFNVVAEIRAELGLAEVTLPARRRALPLPDGRELSAVEWGEPPVEMVFLHGGAQNARTWDSTILALGRPAVAFDLAGHGHSSWRQDATYKPRQLSADVAEVLPSCATGPVVTVGMSLGGLTAIALAAAHPELVRRLVVIDVTPGVGTKPSPNQGFVHGPESYASFEDMLERAVEYYPERSVEGLQRGIRHNARQREDGRWVWRHHYGNLGSGAEVSRDHADLWDDAGRLKVPTTLVIGGASWVVDDADLAHFMQLCPQTAVEVVPGAGHSVQGSHPRALAALLDPLVASA